MDKQELQNRRIEQMKAIDVTALRNAQASQILDALDRLHEPGHAGAYGTDAHGCHWVRHEVHGTFRGSSMRDAMAQLLTAKGEL